MFFKFPCTIFFMWPPACHMVGCMYFSTARPTATAGKVRCFRWWKWCKGEGLTIWDYFKNSVICKPLLRWKDHISMIWHNYGIWHCLYYTQKQSLFYSHSMVREHAFKVDCELLIVLPSANPTWTTEALKNIMHELNSTIQGRGGWGWPAKSQVASWSPLLQRYTSPTKPCYKAFVLWIGDFSVILHLLLTFPVLHGVVWILILKTSSFVLLWNLCL